MINIADLLSEYSKIKNPIEEKKEVCNVLNTKFNINLKEENVVFRQGVVVFKVSPAIKSLLFVKKQEVLQAINSVIPSRFVKNIQF